MRFLPDGPNIPDALITAQEKGRVIFICGAGVSMNLGLPSFGGLVWRVYEALGEDPDLHLAEREVMRENGKLFGQYDRGLRLLERRLAAPGVRQPYGMRERIRDAIRAVLAPPDAADLSNHRALIQLSQDSEGTRRLVTTNFDTLFERAWPGNSAAPTHAGASMPQPKSAGCSGVLHLHGRLADQRLNLPETELVLTSAEFGEAYLRSGWASRYVYDLVRAYTVVLVGYTADDPPMRYLLEVLEADRERYQDLQTVYAFAACDEGEDSQLQEALWRAKGVEPILHRVDKNSYAPLYDSLRDWARYAENPFEWRREALRPLLAQAPTDLNEDQLEDVKRLLSRDDAGELLAALSPSAAWLPVLLTRGVLAKGGMNLGAWIAGRIDDAEMISGCVSVDTLDDRTLNFIENALARTDLAAHRRVAWELVLSVKQRSPAREPDLTWYRLERRLRLGEADYEARRIIASLLRPRLSLRRPWRLYRTEGDKPESLSDLLWAEFGTQDLPPLDEILAAWPEVLEKELQLLATLNQTLIDALDHATDLRSVVGYDLSDQDVPSIAPHAQNAHRSAFYPLIRIIADLWTRIIVRDEESGTNIVRLWRASPYTLTRRLALFADAHEAIDAADAVADILALDDRDFWVSGAQVEIMRLLIGRWDEFPADSRASIQNRVIDGIPRSIFPDNGASIEDWASIHDNASYRRLVRLREAGKSLSRKAIASLAAIERRNPRWRPSLGDRDDFHSWSESSSGPQGRPEALADTHDERLVEDALRIQREHAWDQGDLWRLVCQSDPERAFRGLAAEAAQDRYDADAWQPFLWALRDKGNDDLLAQATDVLLAAPDGAVTEFAGAIASLLQSHRVRLDSVDLPGGARYWPLWDRTAQLVYADNRPPEDPDDSDLSTRALNWPGGVLIWTLLEALSAEELPAGGELPDSYRDRLELAISNSGEAGLLARVRCINSLAYLESVAPKWAARRLVPLLDIRSAQAPIYWRAQVYDNIGSARLFNALRADLLGNLRRPDLSHMEAQQLGDRAFRVVVLRQAGNAGDYDLDPTDLKRTLAEGPDELRDTISWMFWRLMGDEDAGTEARGERWTTLAAPVFNAIWPLDAALQTTRSSENLVRMALEAGSEFADAVNTIIDVVVPFRLWEVRHSLRLDRRHEGIDQQYPKAFLRLLNALVNADLFPPPHDLAEALERCRQADGSIEHDLAYRRLNAISRAMGA